MRAARWMAPVPFLLAGIVFASYLVRLPGLKLEFGLSNGQLGLFVTLVIITALATLQFTGALVARFGSALILRCVMVALPVSLLGLALAGTRVEFALALLVIGALDGLIDVSMNAHAIAVERAFGRPVMNSCHAAWSIGGVLGSAFGGLAIKTGLSFTQHYLIVGAVLVPGSLLAGRYMLATSADRTRGRVVEAVAQVAHAAEVAEVVGAARVGEAVPVGEAVQVVEAAEMMGAAQGVGAAEVRWRARWRSGWTSRILVLGLTGTVIMVSEGAVGNWGGIFLHDQRGAGLAVASLGYVCFNIFEAGARLVGDRLHARYGATALVRCSGVTAVTGLTIVVISPGPAVAIAGFATLGLGLSVLVPLIFSAVGHDATEAVAHIEAGSATVDSDPGGASNSVSAASALSKVGTLTYGGLLLGPALVGWSANALGLTAALTGLLVVLAATLALGLRRM